MPDVSMAEAGNNEMTDYRSEEKDVVVLMSVYNGQQYLEEQISSILNQDYTGKIEILVRDDGSIDCSVGILKEMAFPANRSVRILEGDNLGVQKSFLKLIQEAPAARYYFFADQDDVWDRDKISSQVAQMSSMGDAPGAVCSNYRISDMDLTVTQERALREKPRFTPLRIIFYNEIPGCTMGFNESLMNVLKRVKLDSCMMHDSLVLALAACCGEISYDPSPGITHRIHGDNVVGAGHKKIVWRRWFGEKLRLLRQKEEYDLSEMAEQFLEAAGSRGNAQYRADL
ncbi:MAG: glycosyltransferase, partial [Lachnospiraceae bacterium]|nr:glycosyltransferase [Lachnospiraceae bacterium]